MTLGDNDKESDEQLIQNETDSHPLKSIISKSKTRAPTPELTYRDSGNTIHFFIFHDTVFSPSLKITRQKHNTKRKINFFLNNNDRKKLSFTEFSTRIY